MAEDDIADQAMRAAKRAWRALAPSGMRPIAQPLVFMLAERRVKAALKGSSAELAPRPIPGPVIVSGLIAETKGVSQAARLTIAGLKAAGYAPVEHDLRPLFTAGLGARGRLPVDRAGGVWIVHVNAPEAIHALAYLDPAAWIGRYRIGYWAYELPRVPPAWVRASEAFHEIWAPSRFVAEALKASGVAKTIRVMPHPVSLAWAPVQPDRAVWQIPSGEFCVLAMGDLKSSAARKNLLGAIEIYKRAFPAPAHGSRLILKVQSEDAHPRFRAAADLAVSGRRDIVFFTDSLSHTDMARLIASSDVLLSPHRSEGFGLPLAEARAVER